MNYKALFTDNDTLQGGNFRGTLSRGGGYLQLTGKDKYPMVFILSGSLTLFCDRKECVLPSGEMVIADRNQITGGFCLPDTILLEYTLPETLTTQFGTFPEPITPSIPITGRLETWVEQRLLQSPGTTPSESEQLIDMLIRYQYRRLQPLIGSLRAYAAERGFLRKLKTTEPEHKRSTLWTT